MYGLTRADSPRTHVGEELLFAVGVTHEASVASAYVILENTTTIYNYYQRCGSVGKIVESSRVKVLA
jgi:hypothetical protein